jgi:hypothetical protein
MESPKISNLNAWLLTAKKRKYEHAVAYKASLLNGSLREISVKPHF